MLCQFLLYNKGAVGVFFIYKFIYIWLHWVFIAAPGLCLVAVSQGYSSLWCTGFSLWQLLLFRSTGSRCVGFRSCGIFSCSGARALGAWASAVVVHGLSSCGSRAQLLHGMWDLPGPGLEPVSPSLAGGFLTTAPPGKSRCRRILISKMEQVQWVPYGGCVESELMHVQQCVTHSMCLWTLVCEIVRIL